MSGGWLDNWLADRNEACKGRRVSSLNICFLKFFVFTECLAQWHYRIEKTKIYPFLSNYFAVDHQTWYTFHLGTLDIKFSAQVTNEVQMSDGCNAWYWIELLIPNLMTITVLVLTTNRWVLQGREYKFNVNPKQTE